MYCVEWNKRQFSSELLADTNPFPGTDQPKYYAVNEDDPDSHHRIIKSLRVDGLKRCVLDQIPGRRQQIAGLRLTRVK